MGGLGMEAPGLVTGLPCVRWRCHSAVQHPPNLQLLQGDGVRRRLVSPSRKTSTRV